MWANGFCGQKGELWVTMSFVSIFCEYDVVKSNVASKRMDGRTNGDGNRQWVLHLHVVVWPVRSVRASSAESRIEDGHEKRTTMQRKLVKRELGTDRTTRSRRNSNGWQVTTQKKLKKNGQLYQKLMCSWVNLLMKMASCGIQFPDSRVLHYYGNSVLDVKRSYHYAGIEDFACIFMTKRKRHWM